MTSFDPTSDDWPKAVPDEYIISDEAGRRKHAESLLRVFIDEPLQNRRFLDFGRAGSPSVEFAKLQTETAFGYDPATDDLEAIIEGGPFDVIMAFDVLDHLCDLDKIIDTLESFRKMSHSETKIYIRFHPWTSRHATHDFRLNKAFAHLFGKDGPVSTLVKADAVARYEELMGGFQILRTKRHLQPLEPFFETKGIQEFLNDTLEGGPGWQKHVLPIQFVDYKIQC